MRREVSEEGVFANRMYFHLLDQTEVFRPVAENEMRTAGADMTRHMKTLVLQHKYIAKDILKAVRKSDEESQQEFADESDKLTELLFYVADRVGSDPSNMDKIIEFIKQMPSQMNMRPAKFKIYE